MDSSISHDPFAPEPGYVLYTYETVNGEVVCHAYGPTDQATAQAAGDHLHGQSTDGLLFMVLVLEAIPAAPAPEPAASEGLAFSDGSSIPAGADPVVAQPEAIVPSGEPQDEAPADPAPEAAPATAVEAPAPEGDAPDAPAVPVGTEPQSAPVEVPGVVETMEGQPGPAVNAETGEVTQPGEPLPPIPPEPQPVDEQGQPIPIPETPAAPEQTPDPAVEQPPTEGTVQ